MNVLCGWLPHPLHEGTQIGVGEEIPKIAVGNVTLSFGLYSR